MMEPVPQKIFWYYAEYQPRLEAELGHMVEFREGLPELSEFKSGEPVLLVIDDFMSEAGKELSQLFTKGSHHRNVSIWFLMQNFFHHGKDIRTITLNAQYIILFKNPRDSQQVRYLARQIYARNPEALEEAFEMATEEPHGYLLLDLKQETINLERMRGKILPWEQTEIYIPKKAYKSNILVVTRTV